MNGVPADRAQTGTDAERHARDVAAGAGAALLRLCTAAQERLECLDAAAPARQAHLAGALLALRGGQRLAETLLAFGGAQALAAAPLDAATLLVPFARTLQQALDVGVEVAVEVAAHCPRCLADRSALEAALVELVVNARDGMPAGGRLGLHADARQLPQGRGGVCFAVSDSGSGMDPGVLARAAQPFYSTKGGHHLGMGLAAVDGFARQSGGCLEIRSAPGQGTTASLVLPAANGPRRAAML